MARPPCPRTRRSRTSSSRPRGGRWWSSNVDLSDARVAGLARDIVSTFLNALAEGAGLTLHVRLIEGSDPDHVLEAIFKALGVALAQSCRKRRREE